MAAGAELGAIEARIGRVTRFAAAFVLLVIVLACAAAPLYASAVSRTDPFVSNVEGTILRDGQTVAVLAQNTEGMGLGSTPVGPGWSGRYLLGADGQGRDVMARLLYGGRNSLLIAAGGAVLSLLAGAALGVAAAVAGGFTDLALRWLLDLVWAFPVFLLAISLSAVLASSGLQLGPVTIGADSLALPMVILGVVFVPYVARPVRVQVLALQRRDFVMAAAALGAARLQIVRRHILPQVAATLVLFAPAVMAFDLLTEASLSFLGVGVQSPAASWGTLIADGQSLIYTRPVAGIAPGLAVVVTVLALNMVSGRRALR